LVITARHITLALVGGMIAWQAIYYLAYFIVQPALALRPGLPPAIWLPGMMALMGLGCWSGTWGGLRRAIAVHRWSATPRGIAERVLGMSRLGTTRQLYLLGCYSLLGIGIL